MAGADEAYARLFDDEFVPVRRSVYAVVGDAATAEDLTQDAFVALLLHWSRVSRYDKPGAWVRRVAIRLAVKHLRRERRRRVVEATLEPAAEPGPSDNDLGAAIRGLPARQRAVVALFYLEDRPMKEVAAMLGLSESTGFVHLHRARKTLAAVLREEANADVS